MLSTIGLSVVYFKVLSIGTYIPMVYINYKYSYIENLIKHDFFVKQEKILSGKYPKIIRGIKYVGTGINKSTEFVSTIAIKKIQNYKQIDICPKKLSRALVNTSISYKLLLPVFMCTSIYFANKHTK
jgi:hypothetical protein